MQKMIPVASPDIGEEEKKAVLEVLDSQMIACGPKVRKFEEEFAKYVGVEHAVAVSSGTAALHAALVAHGVGPGDEVVTSPFTFISTANTILFTGAKPVFCDITEDTYNLDTDQLAEEITKKTKAVLPVHLYGHPCEMKAVMQLAQDHGLAVVEDACQAHGATYAGKKAGSYGTGCFSFYPTKNMTCGEGGMITTDDREIADRALKFRQHGMSERYVHDSLGYNLRLTDVAAAIGSKQLRKLDGYNSKRIENASRLSDGIKDRTLNKPVVRKGCRHVFHQYTLACEDRDRVVSALKEKEIGYGIYYPIPIHRQPLYRGLGYSDSLPVCEKLAGKVVSVPVHPKLTKNDLDYIVDALNNI